MTASIPASALAQVIPGVLGAGGNALSLNAVFGTYDASIPIGTVQPFPSATAVSEWFGPNAAETLLANIYFAGYTNCTTLPSVLYFAQFNTAAVSAYVRGASVAALTLAQLQALSDATGFTITIDGRAQEADAINLSAATSFTNAAAIITQALQNTLISQGSMGAGTGRFSGTASQSAGVVTISATASGSLAVGDTLNGTGVEAASTITSFGTYTVVSGVGTVNVGTSGTVASGTARVNGVGTCTYDTLRDAFVITSPTTGTTSAVSFPSADSLTSGLLLTAATGAVQSIGAAIQTPAGLMASIVAATQNWATFMTVTEQTLSNKEAFAAWFQTPIALNRFLYSCQDSAITATEPGNTTSFAPVINAAGYTGCMPVYDTTGGYLAAFQCGVAASINFAQQNGRTTFAFRGQAGLAPQITSQSIYDNLIANGYNCYASFATANQLFTQFQTGQVSGEFEWADTFLDQVWMNSNFQLALMTLLATVPAVPYVPRGYNLIRSALVGSTVSAGSGSTSPNTTGPIGQALNFGAIVAGVVLSGTQSAALNTATGDPGATATIQNTGWYLQILDPGAIVRGGRGTPVINFWYTDGGSVQKISMSSVDVL